MATKEAFIFPVSLAQQRLWFLHQLEPDTGAYNIYSGVRLKGALNLPALTQSLNEIVRRHESLRTTFAVIDEQPVQVIAETQTLDLPVIDLSAWPKAARAAEVQRRAAAEVQRPFDLANGPLLRATLIREEATDHVFLIAMHHIISDGWSIKVFIRELGAVYAAFANGNPSPLADLPIQYSDFAVWQREGLEGEALATQLSYWKGQLQDCPPMLELPTDHPRPVRQTFRGASQSLTLSPALSESVKALSQTEGVSLFMTLLAAFNVLLYRHTGQDDIVIGTPIAGRNQVETEGLIGFFINTLLLRTRLQGCASFRALMARVREVALDAYAHQDVPFEKLVEELQPERSLSHTPLFQVMFNMINLGQEPIKMPGLEIETLGAPDSESKFDMTLYVREQGPQIHFNLVYNADLFSAERIARLLEQLSQLLSSIVADPNAKLTDYSLVTAADKTLLPNPTQPLQSRWEGAVHTRFSEQAQRAPENLAVADEHDAWSYGELEARSNQLAHYLIASGVRPQNVIAIYGHRSASLVWALLGVLKAGAAFVILDPAYPAARLINVLRVAKPRGWLQIETAGEPTDDLKSFVSTLACPAALTLPRRSVAAARELLKAHPVDNPDVTVDPDDVAYVAFTSGSTGRPKGICAVHRPLSHFIQWHTRTFSLDESDRFCLLSGLSHDPLLRDVFTPLSIGATLYIPDPRFIASPEWTAEWLRRMGITIAHLTPAMGQLLTETLPDSSAPSGDCLSLLSLRYAFFGGDALSRRAVSRFRQLAPAARCVNFYGATETPQAMGYFIIPDASEADLQGGLASGSGNIPIGRGINDAQLLVLNASQQLAGIGEVGEIYVRTPYLAEGYLGDDALTQARFIMSPFTKSSRDWLYKTGDLGRYLPDGQVEFAGRCDDQVKIRGFRVEPGEVKAWLEQHPKVREAVAVAREVEPGNKRLVAYIAPQPSEEPTASELRSYLQTKLPEYMIPSAFVALAALPLTPNGKIDRRALPAPDFARPDLTDIPDAPQTPTEAVLANIWAEVLGLARVGIYDNFFKLGGHSLLATRVMLRVREAFQVDVPLHCLFEAPTVAGLAILVEERRGERISPKDSDPAFPSAKAAPEQRHQPFPLTDIQQAYWIARSGAFDLSKVASHRYLEFESDRLDLAQFNRAWHRLIERHDMLRAVMRPDGQQQILERVPLYVIEVEDLRDLNAPAAEAQLEATRKRMSHQVMPPDQWPLFEIRASRLKDRVRLHFSFDYLIADARSFRILLAELWEVYQNPKASLEPLEISFRDYVLAEVASQDSERYRRSLDYWLQRIPALPAAPELPLDKSPGALSDYRFARRTTRINSQAWLQLKTRAHQAGITPSGIVLAAFAEVLSAWSKNPRFTLVLTLFNRLPFHPQVDQIVGDFTSTTLLAVDNSDSETFEARARRIQKQLWENLDHRYVSGVRVLREMAQARGDGSRASMPVVFTSTLNLNTAGRDTSAWSELGQVAYAITQTPQVMLDHQASEAAGELIVNWDAVEELFPSGFLDDMFSVYCDLLHRLAKEEAIWQAAAPALVPSAQLALRAAVNATEAPVPQGLLHTLFYEQAPKHRHRPAVVSTTRSLSYEELYRRANHLGRRLRQLNARPNELVAVVMEKGWEQVAAVLGILASGAAYLPIDPALPKERVEYLLSHGEAKIILTQSWLSENLEWPDGRPRICVDQEEPGPIEPPLDVIQKPQNLAYVIYTSGSTGQPKGVMIDHQGAVNTIVDLNQRFGVGPEDRVMAVSSLSFDLSVYDIFGTLAAGGTIVIPDGATTRDPAHWAELMEREQVTIWNSVPALMQLLVEYATGTRRFTPRSLRLVMLSGDWIPLSLPDQVKSLVEGAEVVSLGGATEASVWSILYPIHSVDPNWKSIPYGRPMVNQTFHVLNSRMEPCPVWVPGQLYIGGIGLAKGYWRDEEKTRARFITHPRTGERLYWTGDLGRYLPDGNIEFLGREDFQVKIQGHRIELGEIEAALAQHPGVRLAVVTAAGDPRGNKRLVAYIVPEQNPAPDASELRSFLRQKLPEYMAPAVYVALEELPLTSNGKVDRRALPPPAPARPAPENAFVAPRNPIEETLVQICAPILKIESLGIHDDFFALGGDSMRAILLLSKIRETFQVEFPLRSIFETPTVAGVASAILQLQGEAVSDDEIAQMVDELEQLSDEEVQRRWQTIPN